MNENEPKLAIRRILVALDASTHSLAALNAAAEMAANMQAELIGLYVEDENLLHLAGLPFAHEVHSQSAESEPMDSDKMQQELKLQASQARRALEEAANRVNARWSFRVVRGQVTASVLAAALDADLLAMGRASRPLVSGSRLGSTAREVSTSTNKSVLLMPRTGDLDYPVLVTYDGSKSSRQALGAAARLARSGGDKLNVLLLADTIEATEPLKQEVTDWLERRSMTAGFHWLPQATTANLVEMVQTAENCVLVLGGESRLVEAAAIQDLLDKTDCPVMLVR